MKVSKDLKTIYVITIVNIFLYMVIGGASTHCDTFSYLHAWETLKTGHIDALRTPVYPIYLGLFKEVFAEYYITPASIGQHLLFLYSIYCFYIILHCIGFKKKTIFWTTAVYATLPGIFTWGAILLTESLTMSLSVIYAYVMFKLKERFSYTMTILNVLILVVLLLLRPAMVYLLPIAFLLWLIAIYRKSVRKQAVAGVLGVMIAMLSLFSYMHVYKHSYGIFATSYVGTYNNFFCSRWHGLLHPEEIKNDSIRADLQKSIDNNGLFCVAFNPIYWRGDNVYPLWEETNYALKTYNYCEIEDILWLSMKNHPLGHIASVIYRANWAAKMPLLYSRSMEPWDLTFRDFLCIWDIICKYFLQFITISWLYCMLFVYACVLFYRKKCHLLSWEILLIFLCGSANLLVAIMGAQGDWNRLIAPSLPFYLIIVADLCRKLKIERLSEKISNSCA